METTHTKKILAALLWSALLGCGGGGDNAGDCFGGDEVCGRLTPGPTSPSPTAPVVDLSTIICNDVLVAAGGTEPAAYALAQQYYAQGATQLEGKDNDGDACEEFK